MNAPKFCRKVVVTNPQGVHARPADLFVKLANRFEAEITVCKGNERVDGKSILGLLTLAATEGTELEIEAGGSDAEAALDALTQLVGQNFAENESMNH